MKNEQTLATIKDNYDKLMKFVDKSTSSVLLPHIPSEKSPKEGDGDDDDDDGRIFPGHASPILNAPRDNISRKGIPHSDVVGYVVDGTIWPQGLGPGTFLYSPEHKQIVV